MRNFCTGRNAQVKRVVFMSLEGCVNFEIAEILFPLTKGYIVVLKNFSSVFVCFAFPFSQHFACISFHSFSKSVGVFFLPTDFVIVQVSLLQHSARVLFLHFAQPMYFLCYPCVCFDSFNCFTCTTTRAKITKTSRISVNNPKRIMGIFV